MDKIKVNPFHTTDVKELAIDGTIVTSTAAELNIMDGVTSTAAELNESDLSDVGGVVKLKLLPVTIVANTDEQDTGWNLPAKSLILDVWLDVTTQEATGTTKTVTVGTDSTDSGDADGFLAAVSVAAAGRINGEAVISGTGTNAFWDTNTRGALLSIFQQGAAGDADNGGLYARIPCADPGSLSVTYTLASANFAELVANICILYVEIA